MLLLRNWLYFIFLLLLALFLYWVSTDQSDKKYVKKINTGTFYLTEPSNSNTEQSNATNQTDTAKKYLVIGLPYKEGSTVGKTDAQGQYTYGDSLPTFNIKSIILKTRAASESDNKVNNDKESTDKAKVASKQNLTQYDFDNINPNNLFALLIKLDADDDRTNNIQITDNSWPEKPLELDLNLPEDEFIVALNKNFEFTGQFQYVDAQRKAQPVYNLSYTSPEADTHTNENGEFIYQRRDIIKFNLANYNLGDSIAEKSITPATFDYPISTNVNSYLRTLDEDQDTSNGIQLPSPSEQPIINFRQPIADFEKNFAELLKGKGITPKKGYFPSLGINLESPQAEADTIGQSVAFVDIFRTARPFREFSDKATTFDKDGWPTSIPEGKQVYTLALQSLPKGAIPFGKYTVLYEGEGKLVYQGLGKLIKASKGKDIILIDKAHSTINRLILRLNKTNPDNPLRNIRIIMPGGTCESDPFNRVNNARACDKDDYQSFVSLLKDDRNNIVFNPDYLRFLKDFKVLRMMNLMEASHRIPRDCYQFKDEAYENCVLQPYEWQDRPKMNDASWGGSYRSDASKRHGVPIEVAIALANKLNVHPWINLPHHVTDEYVQNTADYVEEHLNTNLKIHLEYSNEVWNGIFWAAHYARLMGKRQNLDPVDNNPFRQGYRFYTNRMVEIFELWNEMFDDPKRTIRIAGSYTASTDLTNSILTHDKAHLSIDAVAIAPYFYACWDRKHSVCTTNNVPLLLPDAQNVDDIFQVMSNEFDPYTIPAAAQHIKNQAELTKKYDIDLFAYEGGQHITVRWEDKSLSDERKKELNSLFAKANKDPRMAEKYVQLLNAWRDNGGKLFIMFTLPQTFHRWGNWGSKEHLNQERKQAPKYDGYMQFQEQQHICWWENCND